MFSLGPGMRDDSYPIVLVPLVKKTIFLPLKWFWTFIKKQLSIFVWVYFCFIDLLSILYQYHTVFISICIWYLIYQDGYISLNTVFHPNSLSFWHLDDTNVGSFLVVPQICKALFFFFLFFFAPQSIYFVLFWIG